MKTKLIKVLFFTVFFVLLLLIISHITMPKNNSKESGMHDYEANGILAEKEETIDLLVLGDSEAFTSISPMEIWNEYGYTCYNCSSTEQTIPESATFLIKALQKQKPKIIIFEASNIYRASDRGEHLLQLLNCFFPVVEYHDRWKYLKKEDWIEKINYNTINDMKGYHFTKEVKEAVPNDKMKPTDEIQNIPKANKMYLKALKKFCDNNGIMLSIIRTPTTYSWDFKSYNGLKKFTDENNIEYLDLNLMNDKVQIDWKNDSKDGGDHLNYYGAVKNTKFIGKYLNEKNILKNHKNEEKYESWHKSYKRYKEIVDEVK